MKQKIVLHIGHGKTGSSAIQTVLARNHDLLKAQGVLYPFHPAFDEAKAGRVTSGNIEKEDWFEGQVIRIAGENPGYPVILFSNEHLFNRIDEFLERQHDHAGLYDFEIVLFVRHPLEMLRSSYQQAVKRGGYFNDIADFAGHVDHAVRAGMLAERLRLLGIPLKLFNYSTIRDRTVERFLAHLGVWDTIRARGAWQPGTVNRSLTQAELRFVRDLNRIFGGHYGTLISDALVNRLPDIPAEPVPVDARTMLVLRARNLEAVRILNRHLPAAEHLSLDIAEEAPALADPALTAAQAEVIRRTFPGALIHADGPILRDIAMKYETAEPLSRQEGITLMEYAHKARPQGRIILGKLEQWRTQKDGPPLRTAQ